VVSALPVSLLLHVKPPKIAVLSVPVPNKQTYLRCGCVITDSYLQQMNTDTSAVWDCKCVLSKYVYWTSIVSPCIFQFNNG